MNNQRSIFTRILHSDEPAFRTFYNSYYPRVLAYLHKALNTSMYAEDIAQEVFIRYWKSRAKIGDPSFNSEAYLFTIVRNTMATYFKNLLKEESMLEKNPAAGHYVQEHLSTDDLIDYKDSLTAYESALGKVSPEKQRVFRMHREQGLTYQEIAAAEGVSARTVKFYISDTLQTLRKHLPAAWFFFL